MELGPLQKQWIKNLRAHPERQCRGTLAERTGTEPHEYKACCLGEFIITRFGINNDKLNFTNNNKFLWIDDSGGTIKKYAEYGLISEGGWFESSVVINDEEYNSLIQMNDNGLTWTEIADYVEQNPENVFTKSV